MSKRKSDSKRRAADFSRADAKAQTECNTISVNSIGKSDAYVVPLSHTVPENDGRQDPSDIISDESCAETVLTASGIKKVFRTGEIETEVLKGVDFELKKGEFVAIVGESGSGKSTLLYILAGIDKPTEGRVVLLGSDLEKVSDEELAAMRRRDFSFVYQFDNLVPNLTAYENITLPLMLDSRREEEYKDKVNETIEYLGLSERLKSFPVQLSGGEQQRTAIARALVTEPEVIFLDEPTGSLDKERGKQVMELLADINRNRKVTLVMVTHSQQHAEYASRIVTMEDGRLTDQGASNEV